MEGPFLVAEALHAQPAVHIHSVLVGRSGCEKFATLLGRLPESVEIARVSDRLFKQVAQTQSPQGVAALVELPPGNLEAVLARRDALLPVACGIQDPGNLGTMLRSALAFGAGGFFTLEDTVSPFNPKAVRASAGAIFRLPIFRDLEARALFRRFHAAQVRIVAADRSSPVSLAQGDLRGPLAILIGREASGLPQEVGREADQFLSIPIRPGMDSVNAATAASIFLYEAARQREFSY